MTTIRVNFDHTAQVTDRIHDLIGQALKDIGDNCLEEANRTIPHEEGIMQDTGFVEVDAAALEGQVAYSTEYAVKQHEDPTLKHDPGREDHWLEKTVDRNRGNYERYVADKVRRGL